MTTQSSALIVYLLCLLKILLPVLFFWGMYIHLPYIHFFIRHLKTLMAYGTLVVTCSDIMMNYFKNRSTWMKEIISQYKDKDHQWKCGRFSRTDLNLEQILYLLFIVHFGPMKHQNGYNVKDILSGQLHRTFLQSLISVSISSLWVIHIQIWN